MLSRLIRLPLRLIPRNTVVTVPRGITRGMRWRVGSNVHGCWLGTYEPDKQAALRRLVRPGMAAIDVGANAGFYTLALASMVGPEGTVLAIEPFAENVCSLTQHVALNRLCNVTILQAAASDRVGIAHFEAHDSNSMGKLTTRPTPLQVPTVTLDGLGLRPDIVKIDVEGAELAVLRGAAELIALKRTVWLVALDAPEDRNECRALLREAGYSIRDLGKPEEIIATPTPSGPAWRDRN